MRKVFHDGMSSGASNYIGTDAWSKNKMVTHPKRSPSSASLLALAGKAHLIRETLEVERMFFGNKEGMHFIEQGEEAGKSLSDG